MPRISHLRIIVESEPHSGSWNMAVDEALLETAISSEIATLRFYEWCEPTISLGYFQHITALDEDSRLSNLPAVRRLSGGGAILHDDELTYSIALPSSQTLFVQPHELYDIVHGAIGVALIELGFPVTFRGETVKRADEPMLCFQRLNTHDITLNGIKVLGSAQRRRRGAILQHGSLVCRASPILPTLPGLTELSGRTLPTDLCHTLVSQIAPGISDLWSAGSLTESELAMANNLSQHAYANNRQR